MSEIEKLMQNAGVEKITLDYPDNFEPFYPEFTAEKQLELIKWLAKLAGKLEISSNYNDTQYLLYFYLNRKTRDEILPNILTGRSENFGESLVRLINNLWESLHDTEKAEIKRILE